MKNKKGASLAPAQTCRVYQKRRLFILKGKNSISLETKIFIEILCNLTNKTLEGKLVDQKVSGFLVTADLTKRNTSGA
eukprot:14965370-Ditylum_brightwellii.AAC.1